jgi:DNA-binding GntR family transcriptional regulator
MAPQPLRLRTLPEAIVDRLRQEILSGEHPPGTPLRQEALAAAYGVSRIPLREALRQLEAEGLVEIAPHRGAVVTALSPDEVRDVFELRLMLEPRLLRASIPALSAPDLAELGDIQAAFEDAIARADSARWGALNARLHLAMYRRAPLPRSLAIVTGLLQTSERYTRLQLSTRESWRRAEREHAELVTLCAAGDVEAAVTVLDSHIRTVLLDLERLLASPQLLTKDRPA